MLGITECELLLSTGYADIEQPPLLFEVVAAFQHHLGREKIFFHPYHKNMLKFQPFGSVNGHHGHLIPVAVIFFVCRGQQRNRLKKCTQRFIFILLIVYKAPDGVQQLLNVLMPGHSLHGLVYVELMQ
ncbi:hypothetical protein D9M69_603300 [compost metagenome]